MASYLRRIDPFRLGVSPVAASFRRSDPCTEFACRSFMSLGQILDFHSLPQSFKLHVILAIFISVAMTATSASFRYESLGVAGVNSAVGPT
jgi:hypothetical protein